MKKTNKPKQNHHQNKNKTQNPTTTTFAFELVPLVAWIASIFIGLFLVTFQARLIKLSPVSEKRPPVRVFASTAVRDAYVIQILPFGRCFETSCAVQLSKNFLAHLLKVLPLFLLSLDFLGPPCYLPLEFCCYGL